MKYFFTSEKEISIIISYTLHKGRKNGGVIRGLKKGGKEPNERKRKKKKKILSLLIKKEKISGRNNVLVHIIDTL